MARLSQSFVGAVQGDSPGGLGGLGDSDEEPSLQGGRRKSAGRLGPGGARLAPPKLPRGLQWVEMSIQKADALYTSWSGATTRALLPKEKNIRDHILTLQEKLSGLEQLSLGFMEAGICTQCAQTAQMFCI